MMRAAVAGALMFLSPASDAVADPTLECSFESSSQVETSDCLAETEDRANAALQVAFNIAARHATELDEITGRAVAGPALEASQAAWMSHLQAHCDYQGALFGGGSGTGIAIRACRINLVRTRTAALLASVS